MGGIQAQYAPSAYIGLWTRLAGFGRASLTRALVRRSVVQGTLMRDTIHIVSASDYPLFAAGIRASRRKWWLRVSPGLPAHDYEAIASAIAARIGDGARTRAELIAVVEEMGFDQAAFGGATLWTGLLRIPPTGTWEQRRAHLFGLADRWIDQPPAGEPAGLVHLARRYLAAFGPASVADVALWAGTPIGVIRPAVESVARRRFVSEDGTKLVDLPRAPLPDPEIEAPVRFIPTWDAILLAHARRTQVLPEEYRPLVFSNKNPHSVGTFLVDGVVAGTWRFLDGRLLTEPFDGIPRSARSQLEDEAQRLAAFHSD